MSESALANERRSAGVARRLINGSALTSAAMLSAVGAWWAYRLAMTEEGWRMKCVVLWIAAGVVGTMCLAGAMKSLNQGLEGTRSTVTRGVLVVLQRIILVWQLLMTALVLFAIGIWLLGVAIPGPDRAVLKPDWVPPATAP